MTDLVGRYPLSTADSQAIPLDIIRPESLIIIPFLLNTATTAVSLPDKDCFSFQSDLDCLVQFATSSATASYTESVSIDNALFCPKGFVVIASPPIGMRSISVISNKGNGRLIIQAIQTWSGLSLKNQQLRR